MSIRPSQAIAAIRLDRRGIDIVGAVIDDADDVGTSSDERRKSVAMARRAAQSLSDALSADAAGIDRLADLGGADDFWLVKPSNTPSKCH